MILSNKLYNILKWVATIVLPALSTMCFAIGDIWGWSFTDQLIGSIVALNTFLGVIIGISAAQYNKSKTSDDTQ